ncbi:unnamed protein product, partial [Gulo gulo]
RLDAGDHLCVAQPLNVVPVHLPPAAWGQPRQRSGPHSTPPTASHPARCGIKYSLILSPAVAARGMSAQVPSISPLPSKDLPAQKHAWGDRGLDTCSEGHRPRHTLQGTGAQTHAQGDRGPDTRGHMGPDT